MVLNSKLVPWADFDAVLFDLDGVITPTAELHRQAWGELFADYSYTDNDYLTHIDGKPRYDGVTSFLMSRGIELPWGKIDDPPGSTTICAMGNAKNEVFNQILQRQPIRPYGGTVAVMDLLDSLGISQAVVSSSKNAAAVLASAGLADRFKVVVDGTTAERENLPGKPDPAMFVLAADLLEVGRSRTLVVEDATSGVKAGVAGGFFVVGVDRGGNESSLQQAGADVVVQDLNETLERVC